MAKVTYQAPGYTVAQLYTRLKNLLHISGSEDATDADATRIFQGVSAAGYAASTWDGTDWSWLHDTSYFQTSTKTIAAAAADGLRRTSNVATLTTTAVHGLRAGQMVQIAATDDTTFDGIHRIASAPSTTTFTYNSIGDDVATLTSGGGTIYVISYPLRVIDMNGAVTATAASQILLNCGAIERIFYSDEWPLRNVPWGTMASHLRLFDSASPGIPYQYAIRSEPPTSGSGSDPHLYLWPPPSDEYDINVTYKKRHSKITPITTGSEDFALIVPAEFQEGIYVEGAAWILTHEGVDSAPLSSCPGFMETIRRMYANEPNARPDHDSNQYPDSVGAFWPSDHRVTIGGDGNVLIWNEASL